MAQRILGMALSALAVCPLQAWSFARIGLYQGLVQSNSLRATFMLIWKVGLLPWVLFLSSLLGYELARSYFRLRSWLFDEHTMFAIWAGSQILPCALFLAHASWRLNRHFRTLAAQTARVSWWKRWRQARARRAKGEANPAGA